VGYINIKQVYSHLNGLESLLVHKPQLWDEIQRVIKSINAQEAFEKISKEKTMPGRTLFSPTKFNHLFDVAFNGYGWGESRIYYFVNEDLQTTRETYDIRDKNQQRDEIQQHGFGLPPIVVPKRELVNADFRHKTFVTAWQYRNGIRLGCQGRRSRSFYP